MPKRSRAANRICVALVPDQEREHAEEAMKAVFAPLPIGREQDLAVGVRRELVPFGPQLVPQLEVVVDLAVEDEMVAAGCVGHRLQPGLAEIDDREPPVPERHRTGRRGELAPPRSVRPAMSDTVDSRPLRGEGDGCVEAAHGSARPRAEFLIRMERKTACSGRATRRRRPDRGSEEADCLPWGASRL